MEASAYPTRPIPDAIPEYVPPSPGYGYTWVAGYWDWTGYDWNWQSGYWAPNRAGFAYYGPRFIWEGDQMVFYRGYWLGPGGSRDYAYYGGRGPIGWRARPQYEPRAWRGAPEHNAAWRRAPGAPAGGFRGEAPAYRREERREGTARSRAPEQHREMQNREAEHREMGGHPGAPAVAACTPRAARRSAAGRRHAPGWRARRAPSRWRHDQAGPPPGAVDASGWPASAAAARAAAGDALPLRLRAPAPAPSGGGGAQKEVAPRAAPAVTARPRWPGTRFLDRSGPALTARRTVGTMDTGPMKPAASRSYYPSYGGRAARWWWRANEHRAPATLETQRG